MNDINKAVEILNNGDVVGIPTETVYGLAGRIDNKNAIQKIFSLKDRPFFDPLIVHVADITQATTVIASWDPISKLLAEKFWPGSLTLILPKASMVDPMITSGLDTVGVRVPNHIKTLDLIKVLGSPIAAPSANKFKKTSPTAALHVRGSFPDLFVVDGGECSVGIESTIVRCSGSVVEILRPGMITKDDITTVLKERNIEASVEYKESEIAPGHLKHHYMPELPLIVQFGEIKNYDPIPSELLSNSIIYNVDQDPVIFARILYQKLREFDGDSSSIIFKLPIKVKELDEWQGIVNRLEKASTYFLSE